MTIICFGPEVVTIIEEHSYFHRSTFFIIRHLLNCLDIYRLNLSRIFNFTIFLHCRSPKVYSVAKERLTTESRHFVTASKLFVKSATENGEGRAKLLECLSHCVQMVDRIGQVGWSHCLISK